MKVSSTVYQNPISIVFDSLDKCRRPYYGGCPLTRECESLEVGVICGECLPGYMEDPDNPGPTNECIGMSAGVHV